MNGKTKGATPYSIISLVLRADKIRPGDVLLSHGGEKMSNWIDGSTGKRGYSHAALCVNSYLTYESDGDLIGERPMYPLAVDLGLNARYSFAPGNPIHFGLFRHPGMPNMADCERTPEFENAYMKLMMDTYGGDYSKLSRLTKLANTGLVKKMLFDSYAYFKDTSGEETKVHLSFCSELVAQFFANLGLSLFRDSRQAGKVAPNDLADNAQCVLEMVYDAVVQWPPEGGFKPVNRATDHLWKAYPLRNGNVFEQLMHQKQVLKKNFDDFFANMDRVIEGRG